MSLELRFVTVISNDGITIFHKKFVNEELDEYLFSGFSSAMIAFSKELGDELDTIKMIHQSIFYKDIQDDGTLIISISNGFDMKQAIEAMSYLANSEHLLLMLEGSKIGIMQNENELFEEELHEVFGVTDVAVSDVDEDERTESGEETDEDLFLEALDELKFWEEN